MGLMELWVLVCLYRYESEEEMENEQIWENSTSSLWGDEVEVEEQGTLTLYKSMNLSL